MKSPRTSKARTSYRLLILIIAGASAEASADESTDKFLKKMRFSLFFLTFFNSQLTQSLFKAMSYLYWEVQSLQKYISKQHQFSNSLQTVFLLLGHFRLQLSPSLFFNSVRSNDLRQAHSESTGLVMGHDQIFFFGLNLFFTKISAKLSFNFNFN